MQILFQAFSVFRSQLAAGLYYVAKKRNTKHAKLSSEKEPTFTNAQSLNKEVETTVTYVEESFSLG